MNREVLMVATISWKKEPYLDSVAVVMKPNRPACTDCGSRTWNEVTVIPSRL